MVASMDIDNFYPSINPVRVAKIEWISTLRSWKHLSKFEIENENMSKIIYRKAEKRKCKKKTIKKTVKNTV